jgi:hypothetical protein
LRLFLGLFIVGVGAYGLGGWYGGPWLIERWLDGKAGVTAVRFNPFTLVTQVTDLDLADPASGARFEAGRLTIDLSARSLLERRPVVSAALVESPRITLDSLAALPALGRRVRSAALHEVRIDSFGLVAGTLLTGSGDESPNEARLRLELSDFDGRSGAAGRFEVAAVYASGANFAAGGSLAANLASASGELEVGNLDVARIASLLGRVIASTEPRGLLALEARFTAARLLTDPAIELDNARLTVAGFELRPTPAFDVTSESIEAEADVTLAAVAGGVALSGRIAIGEAALAILDSAVMPAQRFALPDAAALVTADPDGDGLVVNLSGNLAGAGELALNLRVPANPNASRQVSLDADALPAAMLSAYSSAALGRAVTAGSADIAIDYAVADERVDGELSLVMRAIEFAAPPANVGAARVRGPALELAAALLEDTDRVVTIELPFAGYDLPARDAAAATLRARLAAVTATPFEALGPQLLGDAGAAGSVPFQPGDAALNDRARAAIDALAGALAARPRLGLRVRGGFDAVADRNALARQQIRLHVQLATAGSTTDPRPVDIDSARVQDVLDEFAGERLPGDRVAVLQERFECEGDLVPLCRRAYYGQILDALIANEEITPTVLGRLGRFRAQSVGDALREYGVADERIEVVPGGEAVDSPFGVGLAVELTTVGEIEADRE